MPTPKVYNEELRDRIAQAVMRESWDWATKLDYIEWLDNVTLGITVGSDADPLVPMAWGEEISVWSTMDYFGMHNV